MCIGGKSAHNAYIVNVPDVSKPSVLDIPTDHPLSPEAWFQEILKFSSVNIFKILYPPDRILSPSSHLAVSPVPLVPGPWTRVISLRTLYCFNSDVSKPSVMDIPTTGFANIATKTNEKNPIRPNQIISSFIKNIK